MKLKNKSVGARVCVRKLLVEISPEKGWHYLKNKTGTIVERGDHKQYYHTCDGAKGNIQKHLITNNSWNRPLAIKLDNGVLDIDGNNIVVVNENNIRFLELMPKTFKQVSTREYKKALKIIERYDFQKTLL